MGWGRRLRVSLALVLLGLLAVSMAVSLTVGRPSFDLPSEVELFQTLYPIRFPGIEWGFRANILDLPLLKAGGELWKDYGLVGVNDMLITRRYLDYPYIVWTGSYRLINDDPNRYNLDTQPETWALHGHVALTSWKGGDLDTIVLHTAGHNNQYRLIDQQPKFTFVLEKNWGIIINSVEKLSKERVSSTEAWTLLGSLTQYNPRTLTHQNFVCYVAVTPSMYRPSIFYEIGIVALDADGKVLCRQFFDGYPVDLDDDGVEEVVAVGMAYDYTYLRDFPAIAILDVSLDGVVILDYRVLRLEKVVKDCAKKSWFLTVDLIGQKGKSWYFLAGGVCHHTSGELRGLFTVFKVDNHPAIQIYGNPEATITDFRIDTEGNMTSSYQTLVTDSFPDASIPLTEIRPVYYSATAVEDDIHSGGALLESVVDLTDPSRPVVTVRQLQYVDDVDWWSIAIHPSEPVFLLAGRWSKNHTNVIHAVDVNPPYAVADQENYPPYPRNPTLRDSTEPMGFTEIAVEDVDLDGELEIVGIGLIKRNPGGDEADIFDKPGGGPVLMPFIMVIGRTSITSTYVETLTETTTKTKTFTTTLTKRTTKTKTLSIVTTKTSTETLRATETIWETRTAYLTSLTTETRRVETTETVTEKIPREVVVTRRMYETIRTTTTIPAIVTYTTTVEATPIIVPEPYPAAPGILERLPLDLIWIIPAFALGLLLPLPILLRRGPRIRIIYSEPSGLHERAREIASNLLWMAETRHLPRLTTKIQPSRKEGLLEVFVGRKKIYSTTRGWDVDPLVLSQEILRFIEK